MSGFCVDGDSLPGEVTFSKTCQGRETYTLSLDRSSKIYDLSACSESTKLSMSTDSDQAKRTLTTIAKRKVWEREKLGWDLNPFVAM